MEATVPLRVRAGGMATLELCNGKKKKETENVRHGSSFVGQPVSSTTNESAPAETAPSLPASRLPSIVLLPPSPPSSPQYHGNAFTSRNQEAQGVAIDSSAILAVLVPTVSSVLTFRSSFKGVQALQWRVLQHLPLILERPLRHERRPPPLVLRPRRMI